MATQNMDVQKREAENVETIERTRSRKVFLPPVDIFETNDNIQLVADMPGVDENSVDITLEKNVLTIVGNVEPTIPEGFNLSYREYEVGDYQRSFTLSDAIDRDKIAASVQNGVLSVMLPKAEPAKARKIAVKVG